MKEKKEKDSWVQYTQITGFVEFDGNFFVREWRTEKVVIFSCWYDDVIADFSRFFYQEFKSCFPENDYNNIISEFLSWLNRLGTGYFKVQDIMYDCNILSHLISCINSLRWATFKLDSVIMGGYSLQEEYNELKNFIHKYVNHMVPGGEFNTCNHYKYLNMSFDGLPQNLWNDTEGIVGIYDIPDLYNTKIPCILYNATSVVVNFTYYDSANNYKSILFPGDITVHNQQDVASRLRDSGADCQYVFAPHHGSYNSNFFLDDDKKIITGIVQPLEDLYNAMGPGVSTIFSECINNISYYTPRQEFYRIALNFASNDSRRHKVYMFTSKSSRGRRCEEIERGIYLTGLTFRYDSRELINSNFNDSMTEMGKKYIRKSTRPQINLPSNDLFV